MTIRLPGDDELAKALEHRIRDLPASARASLFGALEVNDKHPSIPPERVAVLNDRFDVHVVKPGDGVPYAVVSSDSASGDRVLAGLTDTRPTPRAAGSMAARAWDVSVRRICPTP